MNFSCFFSDPYMDHSPRARDERWQGEGGVGDFAAKVPVAIFGAAAGTASQALLCQNLAAVPAMAFLGFCLVRLFVCSFVF